MSTTATAQAIQIEKIDAASSKQLKQFIDFPHDLYKGDPNYVPMIFIEQEALLNPKKSPFFLHSHAAYFLAKQDNKIVGRIAAIRNNNHIQFTGNQEGFFGFFDVVNDYAVAEALLNTAKDWLKNEGLNKMMGPSSFSTNEVVGCLIENFDEPSFIMNGYNKEYYNVFLQKYGCSKYTDLICYDVFKHQAEKWIPFLEVADKIEKRLAARGYVIRHLDMKNYDKEVQGCLGIYNQIWSENTGFVPMTEAEIRQIAKDFKTIVDKDFVLFAEKDGKMIGLTLSMPNINEIVKNVHRGRLFPTGALKILFGLKKIKTLRVMALGVLKEYRRLGIDAVFYAKVIKIGMEKGIERAECSWILEHNTMMNRAMQDIEARPYRKYRIYEKAI